MTDNLVEAEEKVKDARFTPISHAEYELGRRFYIYDHIGVKFEVISYNRLRQCDFDKFWQNEN